MPQKGSTEIVDICAIEFEFGLYVGSGDPNLSLHTHAQINSTSHSHGETNCLGGKVLACGLASVFGGGWRRGSSIRKVEEPRFRFEF